MTDLDRRLDAVNGNPIIKRNAVDVGIIIGSGLGGMISKATVVDVLPYANIEGMPVPTAPSHAGELVIGEWAGRRVAFCSGRLHLYEGYGAIDVAMTVFLLYSLGAKTLIISNAAGGLNPDFAPGDAMLISDHINQTGVDPTRGPVSAHFGERFTDMSRAYCPMLRSRAGAIAAAKNIPLRDGVYVGVGGPSFETSAERRAFRALGGDAVGMSTVLEVIAANHAGMNVLAFSAITNMATGGANQQPEDIDDIFHYAGMAGEKIESVIAATLSVI